MAGQFTHGGLYYNCQDATRTVMLVQGPVGKITAPRDLRDSKLELDEPSSVGHSAVHQREGPEGRL